MRALERRPRASRVLILFLALVTSACADARAGEPPVRVFASASLAGVFEELVALHAERRPGVRVELHCAGTPRLVVQLREGAPVDLLALADRESMERAVATGRVASESLVLARNGLAIVTRPGNPAGLRGLADLDRPGLRVLLCGPEVPAGRYARRALARAGVTVDSLSDEPSVRAVVTKVELGEVDAGVVYATDAAAARGRVHWVPVAPEHDVEATYTLALVDRGGAEGRAREFVELVTSADGRAVLERLGFAVP